MDSIIIASYTLCDNLLIQNGHQDDPRTKMAATKGMTAALSRSIGTVAAAGFKIKTILFLIATMITLILK